MDANQFWLKTDVLGRAVFPQLPNFCAVAACCGALGSILQRQVTQKELHARYEVALYTKLQAPPECDPDTFASRLQSGRGFSNWDVIRLCNAVLLDEGREPAAAVLCGQDFVREVSEPERLRRVLYWLRDDSSHAIVHIPNHYLLFAGAFETSTNESSANGDIFLLLADSSKRYGPLRSLRFAELTSFANEDERYGFVFVSDSPIPQALFQTWTSAMIPPEVSERQRFARIDRS